MIMVPLHRIRTACRSVLRPAGLARLGACEESTGLLSPPVTLCSGTDITAVSNRRRPRSAPLLLCSSAPLLLSPVPAGPGGTQSSASKVQRNSAQGTPALRHDKTSWKDAPSQCARHLPRRLMTTRITPGHPHGAPPATAPGAIPIPARLGDQQAGGAGRFYGASLPQTMADRPRPTDHGRQTMADRPWPTDHGRSTDHADLTLAGPPLPNEGKRESHGHRSLPQLGMSSFSHPSKTPCRS